jgi:Ser/Thr protein kinase RdoA (MazF antagonist)
MEIAEDGQSQANPGQVPSNLEEQKLNVGGFFPVSHSILSAEALLLEVVQAYSIEPPTVSRLLNAGSNDTYLLTSGDAKHIGRVYGAGRSPSDISYELDLLGHLASKGVSVSEPIAGKDSRMMRCLRAPEGTRRLVLFSYAEGTRLSWNNKAHSYLAGQLAAAIHTASDDFESKYPRSSLDVEHLIDEPLEAVLRHLGHRPDDSAYLAGFAAKLHSRAEECANTGLDWGPCHGDFGWNVHIDDNQRLTAFDFDYCGPGWRVYDLSAIQWIGMSLGDESTWDSFLNGYTEIRSLSTADLAAIPLFHIINHLRALGLSVGNVADWGPKVIDDKQVTQELAFFRNQEAELEL